MDFASKLPELAVRAGPEDSDWPKRLVEEYKTIIQLVESLKASGADWFELEADEMGVESVRFSSLFCHIHGADGLDRAGFI